MSATTLTVLNRYTLRQTPADFCAAISALAERVQAEGHAGVISYRFYVNEAEGQARAVVDYADAAAWIGHHKIAMDWPEMTALHGAAALEEITFLGIVTPEIKDWLQDSTLTARVSDGYSFAAGFQRVKED